MLYYCKRMLHFLLIDALPPVRVLIKQSVQDIVRELLCYGILVVSVFNILESTVSRHTVYRPVQQNALNYSIKTVMQLNNSGELWNMIDRTNCSSSKAHLMQVFDRHLDSSALFNCKATLSYTDMFESLHIANADFGLNIDKSFNCNFAHMKSAPKSLVLHNLSNLHQIHATLPKVLADQCQKAIRASKLHADAIAIIKYKAPSAEQRDYTLLNVQIGFSRPLAAFTLTSRFGFRTSPYVGFHRGVDLAAPLGSKISSAWSGKVITAERQPGYGNVVIVQNGKFKFVYAHMHKIYVKPGDIVTQGQALGSVGNTGRSTSPHLHFEVRIHNHPVDPLKYWNGK